jgi:hypothetical protein
VISPAFGGSNSFRATSQRSQVVLDIFFVVIYISLRWMDGKIGIMMQVLPSQPKTKFLFLPSSAGVFVFVFMALLLPLLRRQHHTIKRRPRKRLNSSPREAFSWAAGSLDIPQGQAYDEFYGQTGVFPAPLILKIQRRVNTC